MRPQIALIQAQALEACYVAERVAAAADPKTCSDWLQRRRDLAGQIQARHQRNAERDIRLASIGMVAATGGALAGGPAALGVVAFVAGAAVAGKAIYHLTSAKLAEIKAAVEAKAKHGAPLSAADRLALLGETRKLTEAVFEDVQKELVANLRAVPANQNAASAAITTKPRF